MKTVEPNNEGFTHLLMAIVKARSVAAENGTLDLMGPWEFHSGLEPWTANPKTVELLAQLQSGERVCTPELWLNLAFMVEQSPCWAVGLTVRGVEMPSREAILNEMRARGVRTV
jgi:hypothetical protein